MSPEEIKDFLITQDERGIYEVYWEIDLDKFSDPEFVRRVALLHQAYDYVDNYVQKQADEKGISLDY